MFDDLSRELEKLEQGFEVEVPLEADEEGYFDKECPSATCLFQFKIHGEDWTEKVRDEEVFCPLCRHTAPADSWFTTEQIEHSEEQALKVVNDMISGALDRSAKRFNASQPRNSMIRMSMEVKGSRGLHVIVPAPTGEPLTLKIECESCGTRYAVLGSAFFCPACGHSSVERVFHDSIRKAILKADHAATIRETLEAQGDRDSGEVLARSTVETALADCVVAFQRFAERLYLRIPSVTAPRQNAFQNVKEGDKLWRDATGEGYSDWADAEELSDLQLYFQRRHLLQHAEGLVDQKYLDRTGDTTYDVGQRIVVRPTEVHRLATVVQKLAAGIEAVVAEDLRGT